MEGLPSDIFDHDVKSFPTRDAELHKKLEREIKKAEAEEEKEMKRGRGRPPKSATAQPLPVTPRANAEPAPSLVRKGSLASKQQKIRLYFHYLPHKISFPEPKVYPSTHEGVDEVLDKIEVQLHGEGGIEKAGVLFTAACAGLEELTKVFNPLGWELSGPQVSLRAAVAANEAAWKDLVKEFAIEHSSWFMFGPGKRLAATMIQMVLAVDNANKMTRLQRMRASAPDPVAPESLEKEAVDL